MELFKKITVISFIGLLSFVAQGETYFPHLISKNQRFSFEVQSEYYNSLSNYTTLGEYVDLSSPNYFKYISSNLSINYSPAQWFNLELFTNSLWAESKTQDIRRRKWIPTFFGGGITLLKQMNSFAFGLEIKGGMPTPYNQITDDDVIVSDGAYFVNPHLWFFYQHPSRVFYLFYNVNLFYRANSLSTLLFNKVGGVLQTHFADFGFSTELFFPVISDIYANQPHKRWNLVNKLNGGSYKVYSVNPASLSFTSWIEWKLNPLLLNIYGNLDTYGQNYGRGLTLGLVATLKFKSKNKKKHLGFKAYKKRKTKTLKSEYFEESEDIYSKELKKELKQLR